MIDRDFTYAIAMLYPELGGRIPDLEQYASSIVIRVLNEGEDQVQEAMLAYYGPERVRKIAHLRAHRLTNPAFRRWASRLNLPPRPPAVERVQALWQC